MSFNYSLRAKTSETANLKSYAELLHSPPDWYCTANILSHTFIHLNPSLKPIVRDHGQINSTYKQHLIINNLNIYLGSDTTDIL